MDESTVRPQIGLAITALVLGILSLALSFVLVGIVLGVIGLVFGLIHLRGSRQPRGMAVSGLVLSSIGILASIGFGIFYLNVYKTIMDFGGRISTLQAWEGVEAPDFTVTSMDGETLTLSELKGKRVIVDFWATWCQPCIKEIPHFNRLRQEVSADELIIVGISKEPPSVIRPFLKEHEANYPSVSASLLSSPYSDVSAIPTTFFIDRNGIIQTIVTGYRSFDVLKKHALAGDYEGEVRPAPAPSLRSFGSNDQVMESTEVWTADFPGAGDLAIDDEDGGKNQGLPVRDWSGYWGEPVSLDDGCGVEWVGDAVRIFVEKGPRDLSAELNVTNAPRIMREVTGDFVMQVRVLPDFKLQGPSLVEGRPIFCSAGILLWKSDNDYVCLSRAMYTMPEQPVVSYMNFERRREGKWIINRNRPTVDHLAETHYLRMVRRGEEVLGSISENGSDWKTPQIIKIPDFPQTILVGVIVSSTSSAPISATFDSIAHHSLDQ